MRLLVPGLALAAGRVHSSISWPLFYLAFFLCHWQALENVKQSLIRLNCLLHLEWPPSASSSASSAVVVRLEEIRQQHLAAVLGDDVSS
jgi:hypothetical protein